MKKNDSQLSIASATGTKKLSAAQREFNATIRKIEEQRQALQAWEAATPVYMERWNTEFKPLLDTYFECKIEFVHLLDRLSETIKLSKADRATLSREISEQASSLIEDDDQDLKALHNKHSGRDFDADQREDDEFLKQGLHEIFGIDLGDIDMQSPDAVAKKLHERFQGEQQEDEPKAKPKNAAQLRKEKAAAEASQSVREVYRKLASALHPDRESDPAERERKTALMQRVNLAYSERNLLDLLQLQLEVEHIDTQALGALSKERLKHYNSILREQLDELRRAVLDQQAMFRHHLLLPQNESISLRTLKGKFRRLIDDLNIDIKQQKSLSQALQSDPRALKAWLKQQRQDHQAMDLEMAWEMELGMAMDFEDESVDFDIPEDLFR